MRMPGTRSTPSPLKPALLLATLLSTFLFSQMAAADNRGHRRGYDGYGYVHHYRHYSGSHWRTHSRYSPRYSRNAYNPYHYGYRRGSGFNISYGNHYYRRHDHNAGYFVGGLVLGSLLTAPRYSPPPVERIVYRSAPVVRTREVVVVNQAPPARTPVSSGRRLLRDLDGNCFERISAESGDEIRIQLDPAECSF